MSSFPPADSSNSDQSYESSVALGLVPGKTLWNKFGYNLDIDAADGEALIAAQATAGFTFASHLLTSGETISIVSSNAADTDTTGTGAQKIIVYGVDENWKSQIEVVDMDGINPVVTTSQWIGVNRISIYKAGTDLKNAGIITATATTTTTAILGHMPANQGTTQQAIFYVPTGKTFLANWLYFSAKKVSGGGQQPEIDFFGYVYSDVSTAIYEIYRDSMDVTVDKHINLTPPSPFPVGEKSILFFTADTDTDNTSVKCRFSGTLA